MWRPSAPRFACLVLLSLGSACLAPACKAPQRDAGAASEPSGEPSQGEAKKERRVRRAFEDMVLATGELTWTPTPQNRDLTGGMDSARTRDAGEDEEQDRDGRWLAAPIPFFDPTLGYGLALGCGYLVPLDEGSPPSTIGGGLMFAENGSLGAALGFRGHVDEDRFRVASGVLATRLEFDLSTPAGDVPLRENVLGFATEVLAHVGDRVYVGPQIILSNVDTDLVRDSDAGALPEDELDAFNVGLGVRAQRDTRDSTFYPRTGSLADLQVHAFDPALGSPFAYQVLPISYDHYHSVTARGVLALRAAGRLAAGDVPFYGESFFGAGGDLRGYVVGEHHDDLLLAAQAEYRQEIAGRWGAVAFAGVGAVANDLDALHDADGLPSFGFGLRFTLEEKNHVNFRFDVAWGEGEPVYYFGVGEVF